MRNRTYRPMGFRLLTGCVAALLAGALLLLSLDNAEARNVYRWTDADGNTHFSDSPPGQGRQSETIRLPGRQQSRAAPSPRVRQIRCRDFSGALEQLRELDDVSAEDARWLAAKQLASDRIEQWCN